MANLGEHKVFIFIAIFLMSFSLILGLISSESSWLFSDTSYETFTVPDQFNLHELSGVEVKSQDYANVTFGVGISGFSYSFYLNNTQQTNDTEIRLCWFITSPNNLYFYHMHPYYLGALGILYWYPQNMNPSPLTKTYAVSRVVGNISAFQLSCSGGDLPPVYTKITFDNSTYDSLSDAWSSGHLTVYVSFLSNSTWTVKSYNYWEIFSSILFFRSYDFLPYPLDYIISGTIWILISVGVLYVIKGWL